MRKVALQIQFQEEMASLDQGIERWIVAYSGGLDSSVLLHLLREYAPASALRVWHVHHGLQTAADSMAVHCQQYCENAGLDFEIIKLNHKPSATDSIEAWAREQRYRVFAERLQPGDALLTAHHAKDQAETVLLQALRGRGPRGLAGISRSKALGRGRLLRPLLHMSRKELENYANSNALGWIEDPSNSELQFDRNYLRHSVVSQIETRWPGWQQALAHVASIQKEQITLNNELAEVDAKYCCVRSRWSPYAVINIEKLLDLKAARQKNLIRFWLEGLGAALPAVQQWPEIMNSLLRLDSDHQAKLNLPSGHDLRCYRGQLFLVDREVNLDQLMRLKIERRKRVGSCEKSAMDLQERFEDIRFFEDFESPESRKRVKKLFQSHAVPQWIRSAVLVSCQNGKAAELIGPFDQISF